MQARGYWESNPVAQLLVQYQYPQMACLLKIGKKKLKSTRASCYFNVHVSLIRLPLFLINIVKELVASRMFLPEANVEPF